MNFCLIGGSAGLGFLELEFTDLSLATDTAAGIERGDPHLLGESLCGLILLS